MQRGGLKEQILDTQALHRRWTSLSYAHLERSFWVGFQAFCDPFLSPDSPFHSSEFYRVPHTGRIQQDELHLINPEVVAACNSMREGYEAFTIFNPHAIAYRLKVSVTVVVEQMLLAVEQKWMRLSFSVNCRSCAFDIAHFQSVNDILFAGTYNEINAFRCPMCTDRTEVSCLNDVAVHFQLTGLPSVFHPRHHRLFYTSEAKQRRLETFFCPAQAGFAFSAQLPRGRYLIIAPFIGALVEIEVMVSSNVIDAKAPFLSQIVNLSTYVRNRIGGDDTFAKPIRRRSTLSNGTASHRGGMGGNRSLGTTGNASLAAQRRSILSLSESFRQGEVEKSAASLGEEDTTAVPPIPVITLQHGKVQFRIYNESSFSGFLDLYISFDTCAELSATPKYPLLMRVPHLMHCLPRGMRSPFLTRCIPRPPSTTRTTGVYVRHRFDMPEAFMNDPGVISVLREVHCYSLEDHCGLLLGVSDGGTTFESSFISTTAALASSICFFHRVLTRLGEVVALAMRCSITEGPLKIAAYQGQYNDSDNTRSAYPDAQFVGSVVYASNHPPITAHYFKVIEEEKPCSTLGTSELRNKSALEKYRGAAWLDHSSSSSSESNYEEDHHSTSKNGAAIRTVKEPLKAEVKRNSFALVRFEIRSVPPEDVEGEAFGCRRGSTCPHHTLQEDGMDSIDAVFPYFLEFLCEHFEGTQVTAEEHALVVQLPLHVIYAAVQMSTLLDKRAYWEDSAGPF